MQYIDLEQYTLHYQVRLAQELDHDHLVDQARQANRAAAHAAHAVHTGPTAPAWLQRLFAAVHNPTTAAGRAAALARTAVFVRSDF